MAARLRLFDTLVAARIGLKVPDAAPLAGLASDVQGCIRVLVATVRATEVDDIALAGCVTAGSVVVPVALSLAAEAGCDAAALHAAIVAGYEAMVGFAAAIDGASILARGIWPTLAAAPLGAAAVAARLARLNAAETRSALALAIGRSHWWTHRALPRWLQLGYAAVDGVLAAQAAGAGFRAAPEVIEGWADAAGLALDPSLLMPGGTARIRQVESKSFPTARQGLAAIQAFMRLHAEQPLAVDDRIEIALPRAYRAMVGGTAMPTERIGSMLSAAYQMALVAHAPDRLFDAVRTPPPADGAIADFLDRVTVIEDDVFDAAYPRLWGARVAITASDASRRICELLWVEGGTSQPFGWPELTAKAWRLAEANGVPAQDFVTLRDAIERDASAAELLECFRAASVRSA